MDEKNTNLQAEEQLAVLDPEAYAVSNPTPRDWDMSAQDIARSVRINPVELLSTKAQREGPEKYNWLETVGHGVWEGISQGVKDINRSINVRNVEYSSPNMTQDEAERLMQDALYTRHVARKSEQTLDAQKIKYDTTYDFSNALGTMIKYVGLGFVTGSPATVGAVAGVESAANLEADMVDSYVEKYGTIAGYDKERRAMDLGLAGAYGVFTGITESMLGVDRIAAGALGRYSKMEAMSRLARQQGKLGASAAWKAARRLGMSALEEGTEEFVQQLGEDVTKYAGGYEDAVFTDENFKKAIVSAAYGAILGGPMGWGLYRYNRKSVIDKINSMNTDNGWGMTEKQIVEAADQILDDSKTRMVDEIATRAEIQNHYGQAYDLIKQRIADQIEATGTTPWTDQNKSKEEYIQTLADSITIPAINMSNVLHIPLSEFLEIADIEKAMTAGNIAVLQPIRSVEDIDAIIANQDAIIKDQREKKKLGIDNEELLKRARQRKAIAERVRKEIVGDQEIKKARTTRKKETADYVTARDLQPEQTTTIETATQAQPGEDYVLFAGQRIPVEYQVVELASIQPSHIEGTPNPNYTNIELQNRASRGTTQDVADLREKATNITPERLMRASTSAEGAPVVNAKGEVIAGNGRTEIVRYAYQNPESAEKYKQELVKQGFNIEGMEQPILIRRNTTMNEQEQIAAADISNISETSAFDEASQARRDTKYLKDSANPTEFAAKLPMSERRGLMQNNGKWNKRKVQQRYEDALLSWLAGNDTQLFENLVLDRGLSQKVIDILTANGSLVYETATKYPELEIREDLYRALVKMQRATRENFLEITQQLELDGHDVMPENILVYNWLFADATTNRQFLSNYATILANNHESVNAGQDMFGQTVAPISKKDALMQALKKADEAKAELAASRGKEYLPLFTQEGEATDVNLAAAIVSFQNQFAPVNTGNQLSQEVLQQFDLSDENARLDDTYPEYTGDRNLVVTHGISLRNLEKVLDLGGMAAPSIAISNINEPLTDFGAITLVGNKNIIDPARSANRVYDRDIWSPTTPFKTYKNVKMVDARKFREKFEKYFVKIDDASRLYGSVLDPAVNSSRPEQAIDGFVYSNGAKLYYIENILKEKVDIPTYDYAEKIRENLTLFVKPDDQFIEEVSKIDSNIDTVTELRKQLDPKIKDLINRSFSGSLTEWDEKLKKEAENYYFGENSNFSAHDMFHLVSESKRYLREKGTQKVDNYELSKILDEKLKNNKEYETWAEKEIESLLGQPKVELGNKLVDWNLENVTKAMLRAGTVNGQNSLVYGVGKVIAAGTTRFRSIKGIKEAAKKLKTKAEADALTDALGAKMQEFTNKFMSAPDFTNSMYQKEAAFRSLGTLASSGNPTKERLQSILNYEFDNKEKYSDELLQEGVDIAKATKDVVRYYFEAKPQRAVKLTEFSGAVMPTDSKYDEMAQKLTDIGLQVERTDNLQQGIMNIENSIGDILFQKRGVVRGFYDTELQAIVLSKYWNETTLVHEYHHRFLEKLWGYFKEAQTGDRAVPDEFMQSMQQLFNILDIDPTQDQLTVVQQEKFATMVEAYLTGLGVDNQENMAFKGFLHWIPEQYKSIMNLGYLDENNEIQNPILDQETITWFNKWFANPFAPSLASAPEVQHMSNATDGNGDIVPSSQKVMNNREKDWGQDSEKQNKADAQLWRAINENTPNDMRAALDGEKEVMKEEAKNLPDDTKLPEEHKPTLREKWFKTYQPNARERAAQMAREYLAKNPDHAKELAFADPETMAEYDAPVDHGMLIRAVMETVPHGSDEWYILNDNLATVKSMSGSTLSLSGDESHQAYLDAKREVEIARELKAAVNYAGTRKGALDKWNSDIRAFIARKTDAIIATAPNSAERKTAIKAFLEEAKTKFSANTTNAILNQLDLTGMQTKSNQVFIKWAEKQIKAATHARIDAAEQKELMTASIKAQLALKDIDSIAKQDGRFVRATQSAKDIRHWQFVKDKMKKAYIGRWGKFGLWWENFFGGYMPSAMLMSANTLFFANVPSTAVNTGTIRLAAKSIGENNVDKQVLKDERERIKQIFNASGVNLAQMDKPTSPSTLHGEKYMNTEQSHWYNFTFEILGRTDNAFRIPTFVDALARIATKNANGDAAKATTLFKEYAKLNTTSEDAKLARKQALAVANMAVFTQDGMLSGALNHIRSELNTISRGMFGLDPNGFGLGNILAPFLKTGANITEMGISASLALPRTLIAGLDKLRGKEITDLRKISLRADWLNLAWTAVATALLCAISGDDDDWYVAPYQSGMTYDPEKPYDSIRFGNTWVKLDVFGPMAIPLRTSAMLIHDWDKKQMAAVADGMFEALSDTPLVQQFTDSSLDYMTKQPGKYWSGFGYNQVMKAVPAQLKTATKAISRGTGTTLDTSGLGKTIDRKFHRNYGLDGAELTTNDLVNILTNRVKIKNESD